MVTILMGPAGQLVWPGSSVQTTRPTSAPRSMLVVGLASFLESLVGDDQQHLCLKLPCLLHFSAYAGTSSRRWRGCGLSCIFFTIPSASRHRSSGPCPPEISSPVFPSPFCRAGFLRLLSLPYCPTIVFIGDSTGPGGNEADNGQAQAESNGVRQG